MIKVILVDDHRIVRDGIKSLIQAEDNIKIIGEAASYSEMLSLISIQIPDIIVLDISLPDISGIEIAKILTIKYPAIRVIILSMYTTEDFIFNSLKAGAKGYLPKNISKRELINAINEIYKGNEYFSDEISNIILKSYIKKIQNNKEQENELNKLTKREEELLKLFAEGLSNKEISNKLFISHRTVESHKTHIMSKLQLRSNIDLIMFAIKNKIINI